MGFSLEGNPVKKPGTKDEYTPEMEKDLALCMDPDTGYYHFMTTHATIRHTLKGQLVFSPFNYQKLWMDVIHKYRFVIAMMGRQMGKCVVGNTNVKVRNKTTGIEYDIPIEEFHNMIKNKSA